jgi:hypothetical protein
VPPTGELIDLRRKTVRSKKRTDTLQAHFPGGKERRRGESINVPFNPKGGL